MQLGDENNALRFVPDKIELETGKLYRLIFSNPSKEKHYFSSEGLSQAVFTRKVQVNGPAGTAIAEVKGVIREIEVYPNGVTEWWFVPAKTGHFWRFEMHYCRPCGSGHGWTYFDQIVFAARTGGHFLTMRWPKLKFDRFPLTDAQQCHCSN